MTAGYVCGQLMALGVAVPGYMSCQAPSSADGGKAEGGTSSSSSGGEGGTDAPTGG